MAHYDTIHRLPEKPKTPHFMPLGKTLLNDCVVFVCVHCGGKEAAYD